MGRLSEDRITITVHDVTGEKQETVSYDMDRTIGELVEDPRVLQEVDLAPVGSGTSGVTYGARRERDEVLLNSEDKLGDVLKDGESVRLLPQIVAG